MESNANVDALRMVARTPITLDSFKEMEARCQKLVDRVRVALLAPTSRKTAPSFGTAQMAAIQGLDVKQVDYRAKKGDLPAGQVPASSRRVFSLEDVRAWSRALRKNRIRPEGAEALTVAIENFKGGVSKTTTAITLAQGLSMRGHKVLVIDADPQGSATTLLGFIPDVEISAEETLLPLCRGDQESIDFAIRPTYWDGIDLVPATADLHAAEFELPARQMNSRNFKFWDVLHNGIDNARLKYDVIIIDTPPSLSYLAINALMAADGLIMPLPPSALDFLSSSQFWGIISGLAETMKKHGAQKEFDFVDVLLSKVDPDDTATPIVRDWIAAAYGEKVVPIEIPLTATAGSASAEFGTVYDQPRKRATQAYDRLVEYVEDQVITAWARQLAPNTSEASEGVEA